MDDVEDVELRNFLNQHWSQIRSHRFFGPVQDLFNFLYNGNFVTMLENIFNSIISRQENRFKINYSFGFILRHIDTHQFRYYHPSFGNSRIMDSATLISSSEDLRDFLETIAEKDFLDEIQRPDTKWRLVRITNVVFYVNKLRDAPI